MTFTTLATEILARERQAQLLADAAGTTRRQARRPRPDRRWRSPASRA
jgi:hypothetical protein